jgi:hypothetical protein
MPSQRKHIVLNRPPKRVNSYIQQCAVPERRSARSTPGMEIDRWPESSPGGRPEWMNRVGESFGRPASSG